MKRFENLYNNEYTNTINESKTNFLVNTHSIYKRSSINEYNEETVLLDNVEIEYICLAKNKESYNKLLDKIDIANNQGIEYYIVWAKKKNDLYNIIFDNEHNYIYTYRFVKNYKPDGYNKNFDAFINTFKRAKFDEFFDYHSTLLNFSDGFVLVMIEKNKIPQKITIRE